MTPPLEVTVLDRRRGRRIAARPIRDFLRRLADAAPAPAGASVGVAFVADAAMRRYNREFRGKDRTTDVLAFPDGEDGHVGDLLVCVPQAARQAKELGHPLSREIRVLLIHGWLHLVGHDHETDGGTMLRLQRRLVRRLLDAGRPR